MPRKEDESSNVVYFAGEFTEVDGTPNINNIFAYDGTNFSALGDGLNGKVNDLLFYDGKLYAGGEFTASGSTTTISVAVLGWQ